MNISSVNNIRFSPSFSGLFGATWHEFAEYGRTKENGAFTNYYPFSDDKASDIKKETESLNKIYTINSHGNIYVCREGLCYKEPLNFTKKEYLDYKKGHLKGKELSPTEMRVARELNNRGLKEYLNEMHEFLKPVPFIKRLSNFFKKLFK